MGTEKKLLNYLKLLFSVCVVFIHTGFLSDVSEIGYHFLNQYINTMAVPFFFVAAGYFYKPDCEVLVSLREFVFELLGQTQDAPTANDELKKRFARRGGVQLPKTVIRLIPPFLVWSTVAVLISDGPSVNTMKSLIVGWVMPLSSPGAAMWFLKVLGISMLIIFLVKREKWRRIVGWVWLLLYVAGVTISSYAGWFSEVGVGHTLLLLYYGKFNSVRNFVFSGYLVYAGYKLGMDGIPKVLKGRRAFIIFAISFVATILEYQVISMADSAMGASFQYYYISPLLAVSLLSIAVQFDISTKRCTKSLRKISTGIYYTHMTFVSVYPKFFSYSSIAQFLFVFTLSLATSILSNRSSNRICKALIC